jgi:IMP dehydrogenase
MGKGSLEKHIAYLLGGTKHGLQNLGAINLATLQQNVAAGTVRCEIRTTMAQKEGTIHHLYSYKE